MTEPEKFMLIGCDVLYRECYYCAALSKNIIDLKFCEKGLHDIGEAGMSERLQNEINAIKTEEYVAILLAYGLCNNGVRGLSAPIPIIIPRAHDCITLFMGSKEKYLNYFKENPGTYYQTVGWLERGTESITNPESTTAKMGMSTYQEYVEKYGEENARYLIETLGAMEHYTKLTYIETGIADFSTNKNKVKQKAKEQELEFEVFKGNITLLTKLMAGEWDNHDFLILEPGKKIEPSYDEGIVKAV